MFCQKVKVPTLFQSENYPSNNFHLEGVWSRGMARWLFIGNQVNFPSHLRACCIGMKKIQIQKKIPRQIQQQKEKMLWRLFIISNQVNPPKGQLRRQDTYKCKNEHQDIYNHREKRKRSRDGNQVNFFLTRLSGSQVQFYEARTFSELT